MANLLSIVVPTKDRYVYLKSLVQLIDHFDDSIKKELELVIQDNSTDNSQFLNYIKEHSFPFVSYFYNKEQLSMSYNSDLAILNAKGKYICFIGDDDGVSRYIVDCAKWMDKNGVRIVKSALTVYKWPSFVSPKHYDLCSSLLFNDYRGAITKVDCVQSLESLIKSGFESLAKMPKVYNGIVSKEILQKIYNKCGTFFPGPSPDMANAVALALSEKEYTYIDYPIIIGGHSSNLGGGANRYKHKYGPLEEQAFIDKKEIDNWDPKLPKIWASRTVWPESAITAFKAMDKTEYLNKIDYEELYRKMLIDHPELYRIILPLSSNKTKLLLKAFTSYTVGKLFGLRAYFDFKKNNRYGGQKIHRSFEDIIQAENYLSTIDKVNPFVETNL